MTGIHSSPAVLQISEWLDETHVSGTLFVADDTAIASCVFAMTSPQQLLDAGVPLNGSVTGSIQTYVTGQAGAEATEAQGEAGAAQANAASATAAQTGLTSALVSAGNAAVTAVGGAAGVVSTVVSGAQRAWKIAAATANGDHNSDHAVAKFNVKMAECRCRLPDGTSRPAAT